MRYSFIGIAAAAVGVLLLASCTQEQQNKLGRDIQNWTGTNGVLEVYAGDKVIKRFLKVDKLSTAFGTGHPLCTFSLPIGRITISRAASTRTKGGRFAAFVDDRYATGYLRRP